MTTSRRAGLAASALLALGLALAGCSATGPAPSGSGAAATHAAPATTAAATPSASGLTCADVEAKLSGYSERITAAVNELQSDPAGAAQELGAISTEVGELSETIADPELKTKVDAAKTELDAIVGLVQDGVQWSDVQGLNDHAVALGAAADEISTYCQAK